jgi:hypothetical protein
MAAIAQPLHHALKTNIVTILNAFSDLDVAAGNPGFIAERDRYRNWAYPSEMEARVNVLVESMTPIGGGSHIHTVYQATVNVDMYVIGGCATEETGEVEGEETVTLTPANIVASDRLDLLIAQVQFALTQCLTHDFGMTPGMIGRNSKGLRLTINNQGDDQTVGVFAPARFSFDVLLAYNAADNGVTFELDTNTVTMEKTLEDIALTFSYSHT